MTEIGWFTRYCRIGFFVWLLGWSALVDAHADCDVINLMPAFWKALDRSDAAAQMRTAVVNAHPDLYNENYISLPPSPQWEKQVVREREYVRTHSIPSGCVPAGFARWNTPLNVKR